MINSFVLLGVATGLFNMASLLEYGQGEGKMLGKVT